MKIKYLLVVFIMIHINCQDKQTINKKVIKKIIAKKKERTIPLKKPPLITQNNVVSFLSEYSIKHPEKNILIKTRLGNIEIRLFDDTQLHRANFLLLVNEGYFNTTCFHRVVKDFIIQAGQSDKKSTRFLREKIGNYKIPPEFKKHLHYKGSLSSARRWNNNPLKQSDPFEFFIVHNKEGLHHLDYEHTVFGKVINGINVIDKIANEAIDKGEWPIKDIDLKVTSF